MESNTQGSLYAADGVNVSLGDKFSAYCGSLARETWGYSPYVRMIDHSNGGFRGPRSCEFINLPKDTTFTTVADGVGTKVNIITAVGRHFSAGFDLAAMTAGDITRYGGRPLLMSNVLDVATLGTSEMSPTYQYFKELMRGYKHAAKQLEMVITGGETAELGGNVGSDDPDAITKFNWAGFAVGAYHEAGMITGADIEPGHLVIALAEEGFRSNGISSVRKAFLNEYGNEWWKNPLAYEDICAASTPSTLYDPLLVEANGWNMGFADRIPVSAIAHITGGGIPGKFARDIILAKGLSAELDALWSVPDIMRRVADLRQKGGDVLTDSDFYETFNGGQGALVVVPDMAAARRFGALAHRFNIRSKICGRITETNGVPRVTVTSRYRKNQQFVVE